jgi:4-cresol dehydrogenase (hydroxylating)
LADALRRLRLDGTLRSMVGLWNDYRVLSTIAQRPGAVDIARERRAWGGATWFGLASIYAPDSAIGEASASHVRALLGPYVDTLTIEPIREDDARSGADPANAFLWGIPHERSLSSAYFKKPSPPPEHPDLDRDRCGVLWVTATLPMLGTDVASATAAAERVLGAHGFEPLLALLCVTERTAYLLPMIVYDRDRPGADARALAAHDALFAELLAAGYPPYRLGTASMGAVPEGQGGYRALVQRIREICDPAGVLMPGRYEFLPPR